MMMTRDSHILRQFQPVRILALLLGVIFNCTFAFSNDSNDVEVFHYWTTASEAKSIQVLKQMSLEAGLNWLDATVEGAAGENAFASLEDRILSAEAPDIGQVKGRDIQRWARLGMLNPITQIEADTKWQVNLPEDFLNHLKLDEKLYAIPIHIHRTNWLWLNKATLDRYQLSVPSSWEDLIRVLEVLSKNDEPAIAQSLDGWQLATLFEGLVLASQGPEFYRKVFVDLSYSSARSDDMAYVFQQLRMLQGYFSSNRLNGTWDSIAISVANGESAAMFMGDWMKGELLNKGRFVDQDFVCIPTPGNHQGYIYDVIAFANFKNRQNRSENAKRVLQLVTTSEFQTEFNQYKGSMPIHPYVAYSDFDRCTQMAMESFDEAKANGSLVPSVAHGLANINGVQHGLFEALELFVNDLSMTPEQGAKLMAKKMRFGAYYIKNQ